MLVTVVYQTTHGNNRAIAAHLTSMLRTWGHEAEMHNVYDVMPSEITGSDLYIFAAPTHIGRAPRKIRSFLKSFSKLQAEMDYGLVITQLPSDSGAPKSRAGEMMDAYLQGPGRRNLATLHIESMDMKGPLTDGWQDEAESFLNRIVRPDIR